MDLSPGLMGLLIGLALATVVGLFAGAVGLDRDRAFYPSVTMVVASYYVLFAAIGAGTQTLVLELLVGAAFVAAAVAGFRRSLWIVAVALAAHGALDFVHADVIHNSGVPEWWPGFCGGYDVAAAAYLGWLLRSGRVQAAA